MCVCCIMNRSTWNPFLESSLERERELLSTGDKTINNIYEVEDNKLSKYCMDFHKSEVYLWPTDQKWSADNHVHLLYYFQFWKRCRVFLRNAISQTSIKTKSCSKPGLEKRVSLFFKKVYYIKFAWWFFPPSPCICFGQFLLKKVAL